MSFGLRSGGLAVQRAIRAEPTPATKRILDSALPPAAKENVQGPPLPGLSVTDGDEATMHQLVELIGGDVSLAEVKRHFAGVAKSEIAQMLASGGLRLLGVMGVAPLGQDPRPAYARLRAASERLQRIAPAARAISAGMSADFEAAIYEGATHLRIGTAITGFRPAPG